MNWYRLEALRDTLRIEFDAELTPGVIGPTGHVEVWARTVEGEKCFAFLNYESDDLLVAEDSVVAATEALQIDPREFLVKTKARGGLWTGPSPW